ncbi:MAG: dosT, partial [Nocardioidaceae bacterium]|nr:dosT [Nocardioidaceae bacterium]
VIQQLFATGLQLQGAGRLTDDGTILARIEQTVTDLDSTIRDIRSTIFELQAHGEQSLRAEVRSLLKEYVPVLGFTPTLRTVGPIDSQVPEAIGTHLVAVLREAASNVARHALASQTIVEIQVSENGVLLRVVDDGIGFPDERHESGMRNVRRRAEELGGVVRLRRTEPHGTTLEWQVPLPKV